MKEWYLKKIANNYVSCHWDNLNCLSVIYYQFFFLPYGILFPAFHRKLWNSALAIIFLFTATSRSTDGTPDKLQMEYSINKIHT